MSFLPHSKVNALVTIVTSAKEQPTNNGKYTKNPKTLLSKAHLTNLNLNHFKVVKAMGLKIIASRSS
jgi:hypothetical protein